MKQIIEIDVPDGKKAIWKDGKVVFEDIYICTPKKEVKVEHEFVDLGLPSGRLWATCNIGAEKPTDFGYYFACGALKPYNIHICDTDFFNVTDSDKLSEIGVEYDTAKVWWGDNWRMPTFTDFKELIDSCTYDSEVIDGIRCGVFTSKSNNQKIVMTAAGELVYGSLYNRCVKGYYWSRLLSAASGARLLYFDPSGRHVYDLSREYGFSVRPVRA